MTEQQKKEQIKLSAKFALKSTWNGIHHGFMFVAMNIVFFLAVNAAFDLQTAGQAQFFGSVAVGIFVISRLARIQRQNMIDFKESVDKILKK